MSALVAGLFLLLKDLLFDGKGPGKRRLASQILAVIRNGGVFELRDRWREILPLVLDDSQWEAECRVEAAIQVTVAVGDYCIEHPDAVCNMGACRPTYSDGLRRCVVALAAPGQPGEGMSLAELEYTTGVPADILKDWLGPQASPGTPSSWASRT